jgi:copper chaperone CopZ
MLLNLKIEGMHCGGCVRRVTAALSGVKGAEVKDVQIGAAKVEFDSAVTNPAAIAKAINDIGFKANDPDAG